jgi:uncharacterized protein (DUF2147 family)
MEANSDPIHGIWITNGDGRVELAPCESDVSKLCGALIDAPDLRDNPDLRDGRNPDESLRDRPLMGVLIVDSFEPRGDQWRPGVIYDPEEGMRVTRGHLKLKDHDTVEIRGCVTVVCRTQTWTREESAE